MKAHEQSLIDKWLICGHWYLQAVFERVFSQKNEDIEKASWCFFGEINFINYCHHTQVFTFHSIKV